MSRRYSMKTKNFFQKGLCVVCCMVVIFSFITPTLVFAKSSESTNLTGADETYCFVPGIMSKSPLSTTTTRKDTSLYSIRNYNTEVDKLGQEPYDIIDLTLTKQSIDFESNGTSEFIDIIGTLRNGDHVYLSDYATSTSSDDNVAIADRGRIIARNKGTAIITITYGNFSEKINVNVLNQVDLIALKNSINTNLRAFTSTERQQIDSRADAMTYFKWTPTKNVRGWLNKKTFYANTTYTGMPYSQTAYQKDKDGFLAAMNNSDFYDNYTRDSRIMPKYGNDCSGFVSFAWNIPRKTTSDFIAGIENDTYAIVGSYDAKSPTRDELREAYRSLQRGDAVVTVGHTFLITANWNDFNKVIVYEQHPPIAEYTSWTYEQLASDYYMPFTMK